MKHAFAIALVLAGWYLMTPPPLANGHYDTAAAISEWRIESGFPTGVACRKNLAELAISARKEGRADDIEKVKHARCFSTAIPQLKEN